MRVHLIDGTYELFRHFYGAPSRASAAGERGAVISAVGGVLGMISAGADHLAAATDHVIESFRNELWAGYKTGAGIDPELRAQFEPLERALSAAGVTVWPMVDFEADDALATAATAAAARDEVGRVLIHTPDKDLAQCVSGDRIVQVDRRAGITRDEAGVREKFGVAPASIPDYLALVGDAADGFPGIPGWGAKSSATVLARFGSIADIPEDHALWDVKVRGGARLARELNERRELAALFRELATLRTDVPIDTDPSGLRWPSTEPDPGWFDAELDAPELGRRLERLLHGADRAGNPGPGGPA